MEEILIKIKAEVTEGQRGNPYTALRNISELIEEYKKNTRP